MSSNNTQSQNVYQTVRLHVDTITSMMDTITSYDGYNNFNDGIAITSMMDTITSMMRIQ